MEKFVQFSDEKESDIIAEFAGAQNADSYPNQGVVTDDDSRYKAFREKLAVTFM